MTPDAETVRVALFGSADGNEEISPDPTDAYIRALDNEEVVELGRAVINKPGVIHEPFAAERRKRTEASALADQDDALDELVSGQGQDYDYVARNCELDLSSATSRHRTANERLGQLLGQLPHDLLVEKLKTVQDNLRFDSATRREAKRRLAMHVGECRACTREANETPEEKEARQSRNRRKRDRKRQATLGSK
jgi:hypothetical protein